MKSVKYAKLLFAKSLNSVTFVDMPDARNDDIRKYNSQRKVTWLEQAEKSEVIFSDNNHYLDVKVTINEWHKKFKKAEFKVDHELK